MTRLAGSSKLLRAMNESATLALLLERGSLTRNDLRELTGLSKPTTSEVLRRLTDAGLAVVAGHTSGGRGPNAEIYMANPAARHVAAVTLRETSDAACACLSAALCDLAGTVVARNEAVIDFATGTDPVRAVVAAVRELSRAGGLDPGQVQYVELGVPGSYDATTRSIRHIDLPGWNRPGLVDDLARSLDAAVGVENDVNLAAIAERNRGVAGDCESFGLIWFGQGLGLAIDLGGNLLRGARGGAGEIGYMPVGPNRGERGTDLHDLVGAAAVLALAAEHDLADAATPAAALAAAVRATEQRASEDGATEDGATEHRASEDRASEDRATEDRASDDKATDDPGSAASAEAFLDALAERIAWGVAAVTAVLDPALVVLAGDLARAGGTALTGRVTAALRSATPLETTIAVTGIADDPVLLGALDAALRAVRERLINNLRKVAPAA